MSIQDLLSKAMQMDLRTFAAQITANAAFLKSIGADNVVVDLLIPWMNAKAIPEQRQKEMIERVRTFLDTPVSETLSFKSVATYAVKATQLPTFDLNSMPDEQAHSC